MLALALCVASTANAQTTAANEWTWVGGSSTIPTNGQIPGVYGTLGVPATGNIPGGRYGAVGWADKSGNLWLFGGEGFDVNDYGEILNDFWEFNPSSNEWAWMGGSSTVGSLGGNPGVWSPLGVPAAGNIPGSRWGVVSWTDKSGNFWLFGGNGFDGSYDSLDYPGDLNDLWEFNPSTKEWAWMGGSATAPNCVRGSEYCLRAPGVYGTPGVPAAGNIPGSRDSAVSWTDRSGNLWLFGGEGYDVNGNYGYLNDLWEFNPSLGTYGEWAWMGGSSTIPCTTLADITTCSGNPGIYGTLGLAVPRNIPGSRAGANSWTDQNSNLWLFGGEGYDASGNESNNGNAADLNDVWEFIPSLNAWAWMGGSNSVSRPGVYGTLGVPAVGNIPGSGDNGANWTDQSGNFWLFGAGPDYLWEFIQDINPSFNAWAWMGGNSVMNCSVQDGYNFCNQPGVYGTLGVPAAGNTPGGRGGAVSWTDNSGNLWLFGGVFDSSINTIAYLNDLWVYQPSAPLVPTTTTVASSLNPSVWGQSVTFTATVASSAGVPPDGELVTFFVDGGQYGSSSSSLSGGKATFIPSNPIPAGTHTITATYSGYSNFASSQGGVSQTVGPLPTATILTTSPNPSTVGQPVTLTATVTISGGDAPNGGTVTFVAGSATLGSVPLGEPFTTTALPVGINSIFAQFAPIVTPGSEPSGPSFAGSTSNPVSQAVVSSLIPTATILTTSPNPSTIGQPVTLSATVSSSLGGAAPAGIVTFVASTTLGGSTTLGTAIFEGGTGPTNWTTAALPAGINSIVAEFAPSGLSQGFAGSASNAVSQMVNAAPTPIAPYLQVNGAAWQAASTATVAFGATVNLGPWPIAAGWSWTGPNGFTSTAREIDAIPLSLGVNDFTATYTNADGGISTQSFVVTVTATDPIVPYIAVNGVWNATSESAVTVTPGTSVTLGPWPVSGGAWTWTGPNNFTSSAREIDNIPLSAGANVYTATYTLDGSIYTQAFTVTVSGCGAANPIVPYIAVNGVWNTTSESAVTVVSATTSVNLGPWPLSGGAWSWTGPNNFTSSAREIDNIALSAGANVYTATYTVSGCSYTQAFTVTVD
jgi:N-acetylneuraminic acid mutarotase